MKKNFSKIQNFTLIELVVVIAIIAITTTIAAVQLNLNSSRNVINSASRDIVNIFHSGRVMALNGNPKIVLVAAVYRERNLIFILQKEQKIMKKLILSKKITFTTNAEKKDFAKNVKYEVINSPLYDVLAVWKFYKDGKIAGESFNINAAAFKKMLQISNLTGVVTVHDQTAK
ncbi:prepilin-type N-terminal cleavage/methylation domain-containing protein [Lentisphaerota bacterium WC36G]|nr:prepilin-type N-terminal cleavage/methylation domain-containing protein [Lentisphaerae bacterium WC36]